MKYLKCQQIRKGCIYSTQFQYFFEIFISRLVGILQLVLLLFNAKYIPREFHHFTKSTHKFSERSMSLTFSPSAWGRLFLTFANN